MLETHLRRFDAEWPQALNRLSPLIHPVDREAAHIWFSVYPLLLHRLSEGAADRPKFELHYQLRGAYRLAGALHTSHRFLYSHRFWPQARIAALGAIPAKTLDDTITQASRAVDAPADLSIPITAVALMTLRQAPDALRETVPPQSIAPGESAEEWLARRTRRRWFKPNRITFNEHDPAGSFPLYPGQDITMAAAQDARPHHLQDPRCFENMGPIPVECRSGSCGTCWIGVLGGNQHLSPVTPYERKRIEYLGYWDSGFEDAPAERPLIRLACQTQASGPASIVIPPWCGVFGAVRRVRHNED